MLTPYYQDETVTIYNCDARAVLPHLGMVDVILTDPPYGIGFASQPTKWQRRAGHAPEFWDEATVPDIVLALPEKAHRVIIWGGNYYPLPVTRGWLSWFKPDAPPSMAHFELAWTNQDQNARQISHSISATNGERLGHLTQKPLAVMKWSLRMVGITEALQSGGVLLDPFMGVGTSLRAAKDFGLKAIGIELSERDCEKAAKRMSQDVLSFG